MHLLYGLLSPWQSPGIPVGPHIGPIRGCTWGMSSSEAPDRAVVHTQCIGLVPYQWVPNICIRHQCRPFSCVRHIMGERLTITLSSTEDKYIAAAHAAKWWSSSRCYWPWEHQVAIDRHISCKFRLTGAIGTVFVLEQQVRLALW